MFKLTYIEKVNKVNNAFAEFGIYCHKILEMYYNGEVDFFELSQIYEDGYNNSVTLSFPPNKYVDLADTYYDQGKDYFNKFEGIRPASNVIGVEEKVRYQIGGYDFMGYIDLILEFDGKISVIDHKSKKNFKSEEEKEKYLRQLYLYGGYIKEKYGVYPKYLIFNMFRAQDTIVEIFDTKKLEEANEWFISTIKKIYKDKKFKVNKSQFFCDYICSVRESCYVSKSYCKKGAG